MFAQFCIGVTFVGGIQGHTGYKLPVPPHLPLYRVEIKHAFLNVGTDYAGPLFIKGPVDTSKTTWRQKYFFKDYVDL